MSLPIRYARWMARDLVLGPGIPMAVLTVLAALLTSRLEVVGPVAGADRAACVVVLDWTAIGLILLATGGLVSADFAIGHQRTLFAKPVSPPLYYLQRWLLGLVAVAVGTVVVAETIAVRFGVPVLGPAFVVRLALLYLVVGGLVFLLSTVTRRDWLAAAVLLAWQAALGGMRSMGFAQGPVGTVLHAVLPPVRLLGLADPLPAGSGLTLALGYGTAVLLGALAVLRWRPLARGARE
ncbi:MAG: hypothetical protein ACM3NS_02435 [Deltaproteobacteria bacterium]